MTKRIPWKQWLTGLLVVLSVGLFTQWSCSSNNDATGDADGKGLDAGADAESNDGGGENADSESGSDGDSGNDGADAESNDGGGENADSESGSDGDSGNDNDGGSPVTFVCVDEDADGWCVPYDCLDNNEDVNPLASEIMGNDLDDNCDGLTDQEADGGQQVCDETPFTIEYRPVAMMILLDASGSMTNEVGSTGESRWEQAVDAIDSMLATYNSDIRFGLDIFPDDNDCTYTEPVEVDCTADAMSDIQSALTAHGGPSNMDPDTPLCESIRMYREISHAPNCISGTVDSYMVVISDGADYDCDASTPLNTDACDDGADGNASAADLSAVTAQNLSDHDLKTFAIGFSSGVDEAQLNAIASAGGTDEDTYIPASDEGALTAALGDIAEQIVSCVYDVGDPAGVDKDNVKVYFDKDTPDELELPLNTDCSGDTGWRWTDTDRTVIEFCADSCAELKDHAVNATFGCPSIVG